MSEMSMQYDQIVDLYAAISDANLIRAYVEQLTFLKVLGSIGCSIGGRSILDVACGTRVYSSLFKQRGASRIVAVDIASEMIAVAKRLEEQTKLGVEYLTYDVAEIPTLGSFDVVTAVAKLRRGRKTACAGPNSDTIVH
jgi:2-polyprenyl-3-methyl-5-hydroxy-6-metoxy-1,4-benzoquinol methylase